MLNLSKNSFLKIVVVNILTWILFLASFVFLTKALMMIMNLEYIALILFAISLIFFITNYFIYKYLYNTSQIPDGIQRTSLQSQHDIIHSLDNLVHVIIILVSLGLISALSTFVFVSMSFIESNNIFSILNYIPLLIGIYLLFIIPSTYGLIEIGNLKTLINRYQSIKSELKDNLNTSLS